MRASDCLPKMIAETKLFVAECELLLSHGWTVMSVNLEKPTWSDPETHNVVVHDIAVQRQKERNT